MFGEVAILFYILVTISLSTPPISSPFRFHSLCCIANIFFRRRIRRLAGALARASGEGGGEKSGFHGADGA